MRCRLSLFSSVAHLVLTFSLVSIGGSPGSASPSYGLLPSPTATATATDTEHAISSTATEVSDAVGMRAPLFFLSKHWMALLTWALLLLTLYFFLQGWALRRGGPKDAIGNGITIGQAKAFDNRSLALRIERLSASLKELKVVSQNVTANLSTLQGLTSTESSRSLTLGVASSASKTDHDSSSKVTESDKGAQSDSAPDDKPAVALAASDILSDQLNLASQILNLETLYERSLTDRLIKGSARLQTVLGFQVSITPPAGYENCVAVAEIAVRMKLDPSKKGDAPNRNDVRISLVALIPQEKTYNSQSISTSSESIGGSAVESVVTLGLSSKGESRQLFIHRDSDTIAFERDPRTQPTLFENDSTATVFGWEFRPVLGRTTVTAGTRQMLAVIAVPQKDVPPEGKEEVGEAILEIKTRSYWRRYNPKRQTSSIRWRLVPFNVDGSNRNDSEVQELEIPNTAKIQRALAPTVSEIKWVNSGADRANVIVKGENFFSGTKVVTGGKVHREEDGSLTLKSEQALEFETTVASLVTGDSVLSGRFGSSFQLAVPAASRPVWSLAIARAVIEPSSYTKVLYMIIDVKGLDNEGEDQDLTVADIQNLPEPILFVGNEPVPMPYDYFDLAPEPSAVETKSETETAAVIDPKPSDPTTTGTERETETAATSSTSAQSSTKKYIQVGAWIPKTLGMSPSVAFRVPFCGFEYQTSFPLNYSEPEVTRMGGDAQNLVLRISHPLAAKRKVSVKLDRNYVEGGDELNRITDSDFLFKVSTQIVTQHNYLVLSIESAEPGEPAERYLLTIPAEEKPKPKTMIETRAAPPQITRGSLGPVEWSGISLEAIKSAALCSTAKLEPTDKQGGTASNSSTAAQFTVYDGGKRIAVYFSEGSTQVAGKAEVEFQTTAGDTLHAPLFIAKEA